MAHKTETSREYPWPPEVARIIYDYYFDAPEILAADKEFYALCVDGTLHVCPRYAGPFTYTDIESISSNDLDPGRVGGNGSACVVIKRSGEVFARGYQGSTTCFDFDPFDKAAIDAVRADSPATSVYHTPWAFAVLFENGNKVFWGNTDKWQPNLGKLDLSKVDTLFANNSWFAALMKDKTVQTWPANDAWVKKYHTEIESKELQGVVRIYSTTGAFAALRGDGTVVTWGHKCSGGDSRGVNEPLTKVKDIFNTDTAFAALKEDGTVVTWGAPCHGGDSRVVSKELKGVEDICAAYRAFAARRRDGSVVTWGWDFGVEGATGIVSNLPPVLDIKSSGDIFGARTCDDEFVTWEHPDTDIKYPVQEALGNRHVTQLYSNRVAFTAIADTTALTVIADTTAFAVISEMLPAFKPEWWRSDPDVTDIGSHPRIRVVSQRANFLATIDTGDVVAWGQGGIRFVDRGYADLINQHQRSIRVAFKNATGMV